MNKAQARFDALGEEVTAELRAAAPWLELGDHAQAMIENDDVFDAVITALIARAAALRGMPVSSFVRDAVLRVAERVTPFKRAVAAQLAGRP